MELIRKYSKYWYVAILAIYCITPLLWFLGKDSNVLINGLDTNFPLNPLVWFSRRLFVWNGVLNAGVNFSSSTAGLFFHFIQLVPFLLGLSLRFIEIFSLIFWFSAAVLSSYYLAKTIVPKSKIAQIFFVTIYVFNIYLFNTWENVKVANLSLVAALPLFVSILYRWKNGAIFGRKVAFLTCFASILASGAGINPAYFSIIVIALLVETMFLKEFKKGAALFFTLLAVNSFWIIPLLNFLMSNRTSSLADLGLTNWLYSLSENTSIINIIRLQGAWDWYALDRYGMPQYLPYALNYLYRLPFVVFSFFLPLTACLSLVFINSKKRFWYLFLGFMALAGIFFGVGSHPPTGSIFIYLYNHIPFLSFFRSPWYIFTPLLTLAYAGLTALFFEQIYSRVKSGNARHLIGFLGFVFLLLYGLYNYPLITGKIFRPDRDGFYVKFPQHVWDTKAWLSENKNLLSQRIISYPDDDLETFDWGYKGTESILGLFSDRELIGPSYNIQSKAFGSILKSFYSFIKRGEYASAISMLNFFGADTIFYKKDSPSLSPPITEGIDKLTERQTFDNWAFLKVKKPINQKIFAVGKIYNNLSYPDNSVFQIPILEDGGSVIVNGAYDTEVVKILGVERFPVLIKTENLAGNKKEEISNYQKYVFSVPRDGEYYLLIEKQYLKKGDLLVTIDSLDVDKNFYNEQGSFIKIGPVKLSEGRHIVGVLYPEAENLFKIKDFSFYAKDLGLRKEELPPDIRKTLVAVNFANEDKIIKFSLGDFNPFLRYAVGFDYKYIYGSVPILDLIQSTPSAPIKTHPIYPGSSMDWEFKYEIYEPVETASSLELFLRLSPNKPGDRSKTFFENIFVRRIYDNKVFVEEDKEGLPSRKVPGISFQKLSPVRYKVEIVGDYVEDGGVVLAFLESYSKGWKIRPLKKRSILEYPHFTINGYANGWYIPHNQGNSSYLIYYEPQRLYLLGAVISIGTVLFIFTSPFIRKWKKL